MTAAGLSALTRNDVVEADGRIRPYVRETPLLEVDSLVSGVRVALKLECLQVSGSFKMRGAVNRILVDCGAHERVTAASGGNHGAAVAFACRALGLHADVFLPSTAPAGKVARIVSAGATPHLVDGPFPAAAAACARFAAEEGALLVHPFDDPLVVAAQGTLGLELLRQLPEVTTVLVSVGGGGFAAGVATALAGGAKVVAVEPARCPTLAAALEAGRPVTVPVGGIAADSLGAPSLGAVPFAVLREAIERVVLVPEDRIARAQRELWETYRLLVEPAAACAWAALDDVAATLTRDSVVAVVLCGANLDASSLLQDAA